MVLRTTALNWKGMNPYATIALLGLVAIVQSTVLSRADANGLYLQLMLLVVISWSLLRGSREGMVWGFIGGLALDLLSAGPVGLNAGLLALAGYSAGWGEAKVFRANLALPAFIIGAITLGYALSQSMVLQALGHPIPWFEWFTRIILPTLVLNLVASPLVYRPLRWLSHHTGGEKLEWR